MLPGDLRQHLLYLAFLSATSPNNAIYNTLHVIHYAINQMASNTSWTIGYWPNSSYRERVAGWEITSRTKQHYRCWSAVQYLSSAVLTMPPVSAARMGKGVT